ncbi:MAG: TIGR03663 family protein [Vicinamibacterales bacterium]
MTWTGFMACVRRTASWSAGSGHERAARAAFGCVVLAALTVALAFRLARADLRPMHHDEANQAVKFGELLETGAYRYDRNDHHGPTLYYLTLPAAWLRGQHSLASLDERTLRAVPAAFGAGLLLLFLPLTRGFGRPAVAAAAVLAAVSPVLTFYSRFFIQESLFVFFSLGFLVALGRLAERPRAWRAACAGAFAGLAYATKETSVIVLPAAVVAVALARLMTPLSRVEGQASARSEPPLVGLGALAAGAAAALLVAFVFFSSFLRYPGGLLESIRAFGVYLDRGVGSGPHTQPFDYYVRLLSYSASGGLVWSEGAILALAVVGLVAAALARNGFWPRYVGLHTLITLVAFSAIRYKTPWNLVPFYAGAVLMAGYGTAAMLGALRSRLGRGLVAGALLAAVVHLAVQDWRANFRYPADPRNPYVYAHTVPDFLRLAERVTDIAALHPDRSGMLVKVFAGPYEQWPIPWYLRGMTRVGYWPSAADAGRFDDAPVVIAAQDQADTVGAALGDRYVQESYGLRPEVLLNLFIERESWDRLMAAREAR